MYLFYLAMRNKYFFHQNMFLYYIRGLLHPHCYTDHYVMQEQPSFQYYELVIITCTCNTVQTQFYIGKIPSYFFSRPRAKDLQLFLSLICKHSTPTPLQPHRTPADHDLNKLESKVLLGASTQVSAFLAKCFFKRFLKNTKIFSIILY